VSRPSRDRPRPGTVGPHRTHTPSVGRCAVFRCGGLRRGLGDGRLGSAGGGHAHLSWGKAD